MTNRFNKIQSEKSLKGFTVARSNLLLVGALTIVNLALLVSGSDTYFLFSASVPYIITSLAMYLCGMFPEEYYEGGYESYDFFGGGLFGVALVISIAIIALYFLMFFLLRKKKKIWLIIALVIFSIDTVVMFAYYGLNLEMSIDMLFHIYLIVSFSIGIYSAGKLKNMEENGEDLETVGDGEIVPTLTTQEDSVRLRIADTMVKSKTLLEAEAFGHKIVYRRVKRVNELVVDGSVYDEYEALLERTHMLTAVIDGHSIAAGLDGSSSRSYIMVDGQTLASKLRLI